ncbi:Abscisic acid cluster transcription factor abl7 like protein [Verticillium longisporum]|uniref:Abscisic acid cluster transcription factor abl7 like protein n=2 Tax=Verticillium longisporum TaxID=100787 RepID=A0A8I3AXU0_VERLO|nr:Abscisic acid cluster transcription factor abl7 like protein [Verticillium longisporum]
MATPKSSDGPPPRPNEPPPVIRISCRRCRGRKLKCDRATPRCSRCVKADEDCEYPGSRKTNVGKRTQVRELEAKLGQLENKIKIISAANEPEINDFPDIATANFDPFLQTGTAFGSLPIHTHPAVQPTPPYDNHPSQTEITRLGLFEQLPAIELIEALTAIFFDELHHAAPMLHQERYIASLYLPAHMRPPMCLQYIVMASAATVNHVHQQLAMPFYQRARAYAESDEMKIHILLPASEEAFKSGVEEKTSTLKSVLQGTGERYSSFAGRILAAHLFHKTMEHTEQPAAKGNPEDVKNGLYWEQHRDIDNSLATLLMALPETLRLPRNIRSPNAVFVNVMNQAAIISLHRAAQWTMRSLRDILPEHTVRQSQNRLLPAAEEILHVFRMVPDIEATMQNAMLTFAAYMAALVFLEDFAAEHSQQSESNMDFLVGMLVTVGRNNAMVASLANQLAIDMHHLGIKSSVATKAFEFLAPKLAEKMADSPGVNFCLLHGPPRADDTALAGTTPQSSTPRTISPEKSGLGEPAGSSQFHDEDEMMWANTIAESPPVGLRYPYEAMTW